MLRSSFYFIFFFNDPATTEIYTLSLHDALPIYVGRCADQRRGVGDGVHRGVAGQHPLDRAGVDVGDQDRKSTRLNSSHGYISYAVFCLKKKKKQQKQYDNHITREN